MRGRAGYLHDTTYPKVPFWDRSGQPGRLTADKPSLGIAAKVKLRRSVNAAACSAPGPATAPGRPGRDGFSGASHRRGNPSSPSATDGAAKMRPATHRSVSAAGEKWTTCPVEPPPAGSRRSCGHCSGSRSSAGSLYGANRKLVPFGELRPDSWWVTMPLKGQRISAYAGGGGW